MENMRIGTSVVFDKSQFSPLQQEAPVEKTNPALWDNMGVDIKPADKKISLNIPADCGEKKEKRGFFATLLPHALAFVTGIGVKFFGGTGAEGAIAGAVVNPATSYLTNPEGNSYKFGDLVTDATVGGAEGYFGSLIPKNRKDSAPTSVETTKPVGTDPVVVTPPVVTPPVVTPPVVTDPVVVTPPVVTPPTPVETPKPADTPKPAETASPD